MLEWKYMTGDKKLKEEIERVRNSFDTWFEDCWAKRCTKEQMLGEYSPVRYVAICMTKTPEEIKKEYPFSTKEQCRMCDEYVHEWIEASFSFCNEYDCGMSLCKDCLEKMSKNLNKFE